MMQDWSSITSAQVKEIEGICGACGRAIPKGEEHASSQQTYLFLPLPPPPPLRICKGCVHAMLAEYRRKRIAELVPGLDRHRSVYLMKELLMLQPRGPRLLVKRVDAPKPTSSTIIIPETIDGEKSCYALVIAIGNKVAGNIKVADTVILARYCGSPVEVTLDGETLEAQIVMEDDVLAVVDGE